MKKILLLALGLISTEVWSQQTGMEKIALSTCECVSEKNMEGKTREEIEMQFGFCLLGSVSQHKKEFDEIYKGKSVMEIDMEKFGEEIGMNMAIVCPEILMQIDFGVFDEEETLEISIELGKIKSIEKKQFNIVNLEVGDGSVLKFLWLWDFEGSELLIKNQYKNKWVNIYYYDYPLYDPDKKAYVNYKVIEGIELGE